MPFRELEVESQARELVVSIYEVTEALPQQENFGLTREIRRSALSVGSNIAEGVGRRGNAEFRRFIDIALGSLRELRFQMTVAHRLDYLTDENRELAISECDSLRRHLIALKRSLD